MYQFEKIERLNLIKYDFDHLKYDFNHRRPLKILRL